VNDYNRGALPDPCLRFDYGFGEEWASVELGDGTGYVRLADYKMVKAENAKLRKIARAHAATLEGCGCDHCPHEHDCDPETVPMRDGCRVRDELRELGVDA
jgi:hypothetical protein